MFFWEFSVAFWGLPGPFQINYLLEKQFRQSHICPFNCISIWILYLYTCIIYTHILLYPYHNLRLQVRRLQFTQWRIKITFYYTFSAVNGCQITVKSIFSSVSCVGSVSDVTGCMRTKETSKMG